LPYARLSRSLPLLYLVRAVGAAQLPRSRRADVPRSAGVTAASPEATASAQHATEVDQEDSHVLPRPLIIELQSSMPLYEEGLDELLPHQRQYLNVGRSGGRRTADGEKFKSIARAALAARTRRSNDRERGSRAQGSVPPGGHPSLRPLLTTTTSVRLKDLILRLLGNHCSKLTSLPHEQSRPLRDVI
jgi:hypothetical protein